MSTQKNQLEKNDIRLAATKWIGSLSVFCLLACVPIIALIENYTILPLAVIIAATVSTVSIWLFVKPTNLLEETEVKQLQERLSNLEEIICRGDFDYVRQELKS